MQSSQRTATAMPERDQLLGLGIERPSRRLRPALFPRMPSSPSGAPPRKFGSCALSSLVIWGQLGIAFISLYSQNFVPCRAFRRIALNQTSHARGL
jgi:hypothetical protein